MRQTSFLKKLGYTSQASHGGDKSRGKRKVRRPLDSRFPVHLILRSEAAKGALSLLRQQNRIYKLVMFKADTFHVKIEGYANVGNHLHIKARFKNRASFQNFLRTIAALIARVVTGARRGHAFGKFWSALAYTKVVKVWQQEKRLDKYIVANNIEAQHGAAARTKFLNDSG